MEMPEEPSQAEMTDEPVEENVTEPAVQEPALESSEASVFADEVTDNSDINRDDDIDSTIQDVATSSNNNTSEGKTSSEGIHETASKALPEEGFESLTSRYVKRHFNYIRDMIQGNLSYPSIARRMGWTGKVIVSFVVCKDGRVENIKIVESSGFAILDRNAMETIKKVSPFPRPPVSAELIVPIAYMLR
jgi:protein TonB